MPTKHPRIGVVRDDELDRALRDAGPLSGERSDAARVRALALRGAQSLLAEDAGAADREFVRRHGLRPAGHARPLSAPRGPITDAATEALDWARGGR